MERDNPCLAYTPRYIYIETSALKKPMALEIMAGFPYAQVHEIVDHRHLDSSHIPLPLKGFTTDMKRNVLVLASNPGGFIREFRGYQGTGGRKEYFIAHANGCPFDCQYCYLQCYFSHGAPVLFVDQDDLFEELSRHIANASAGTIYHAGELSDSLALEKIAGFASKAIPLFGHHPQVTLELRTKCAGFESVLPANPPRNVVVSWTLSPDPIAKELERGTPAIEERIRSAARCQHLGYRVGIRMDPIVRYRGWEQGYKELVQSILGRLDPHGIESFVLGGFRYPPELAPRVRARFPRSRLFLDEFVPCSDGKFRYFRPLRVELYRTIIQEIRSLSSLVPVTLCMETDQVSKDVEESHL